MKEGVIISEGNVSILKDIDYKLATLNANAKILLDNKKSILMSIVNEKGLEATGFWVLDTDYKLVNVTEEEYKNIVTKKDATEIV
jgi:hypothetical protein